MKGCIAISLLQTFALSLWAGSLNAAVCDFGDFDVKIELVDEHLEMIDAGGRRAFQPVIGETGFWFAISYSDHGKQAEYLVTKDHQIILTVHSIGQLVISETFEGVCEKPIEHTSANAKKS